MKQNCKEKLEYDVGLCGLWASTDRKGSTLVNTGAKAENGHDAACDSKDCAWLLKACD